MEPEYQVDESVWLWLPVSKIYGVTLPTKAELEPPDLFANAVKVRLLHKNEDGTWTCIRSTGEDSAELYTTQERWLKRPKPTST